MKIRDNLAEVVDAFEKSAGLNVCIRPLGGIWRDTDGASLAPGPYTIHRSAFCERIKQRQMRACRYCDADQLRVDCTPGCGPFVRRCHAGADEVIVPLTRGGALLGVAFVGPFRRAETQPGELPRLPAAQVEQVRRLSRALGSYILEAYDDAQRRLRLGLDDRRGAIESFIMNNLHRNPSLGELADHLSLSVTRTGHLVRELTGQSFLQLKQQRMLESARHLLISTPAKLEYIAAQVGFSDAGYFARFFRRKTGRTPTAYRRQGRPANPQTAI